MDEHTEYRTLTTGKNGRIAPITLNRPDRLNAIDTVMPGPHDRAQGERWWRAAILTVV